MASPRQSKNRSAFTLIETALALGIVAFALVPVIALLPIGLQTSKTASDLSVSAQIAQRLAGMVQQSDESAKTLTGKADAPASTLVKHYYYFDAEGQPVGASSAQGTGATVPANTVYAACLQRPPLLSTYTAAKEEIATTLYVQVVNDPGHRLHADPASDTLPPELQGHAVIVPVFFAYK